MIIVDNREKNSMVVSELVSNSSEIRFERLEVADYIVGDIAIERKTINDFVGSMFNKRLLRQISELKQYKKQILIIEGSYDDINTKVNINAVKGMILSIIFDFNIPIIFSRDSEETASFLYLLEKKQGKTKKETSFKAKRRASSLAEHQRFILESFPGIGPKTAKELLKKFKTIKKITNASEDELKKVKKLNGNKIKIIKKIIDAKYLER